ncbi:MAG: tetratricopeptide repeat protein [Kofleriaceae bacterium]
MSTPKGPGGKTPKPFLGDEELSNELDAWDSMFDNLHEGGEAPPSDEPVMAWPAPAATPVVAPVGAADATRADLTIDKVAEDDIEEQMTLDRAVSDETSVDMTAAPPQRERTIPAAFTKETADEDPNETDFSDIGASESPSALGDFLGNQRPTTASGIEEEDIEDNDPHTSVSITAGDREPTPLPLPAVDLDDDDIYTSASRPRADSLLGDDYSLDEPIPPPVATPRTAPPGPPPNKRTGPAIIRRQTPVAVPLANYAPVAQSVPDESPFAESPTRIADIDEMQSHAEKERAEARSKAPTAPPPIFAAEPAIPIDEDDYADIEIGADAAESAPASIPPVESAPVPRRTAAHVVRRPDKSTKIPIVAPVKRESDPVIEVSEGPAEPAGEDDFSDVAAAVGANDDLGDIVQVAPPVHLDSALDSIDLDEPSEVAHSSETVNMSVDDVLAQDDDEDNFRTSVELVKPRHAATVPAVEPSDDDEDIDFGEGLAAPSNEPAVEMEAHDPTKTLYGLGAVGHADRSSRVSRPPPVAAPPSAAAESFQTLDGVAAPRKYARLQTPLPVGDEIIDSEPAIDLEAIQLPEQVQPLPTSQLEEEAAKMLAIFERELATVDESAASAALRIEAGRLSERLGDIDRARSHYDAALLADPRATAALRGLRRIARSQGDLIEATRQVDAELAVAGALERRPLGHYRIDMLLASGEQDLARVAVGEILDSAPSDVRALLAQLELTFLDGRADEFGGALEQLAHAVTDNELRAAVQSARGVLAAHQNDAGAAATWFAAAAESDPTSLLSRLGAVRQAVARQDAEASSAALFDLGRHVVESDPISAAALALRVQHHAANADAATLAANALPGDPLVLRVAAETASQTNDPVAAGHAFAAWASSDTATPAERSYAAARAAELDPARGAELWLAALSHDPGDDYAAQQLRTAHITADATQLAIDVDLDVAKDTERERATLRAAFGLIGQSNLEGAIELLQKGHAARPDSLALTEALAEALAAASRWSDRAKLLAELAENPGEHLDREVAQLRSALAWEEAVGAATAVEPPDTEEIQRTTASALDAWERVLEGARGNSPAAHAAAIVLAQRLGDRDVINEVLQRAQRAEASPWAASSLALRRARSILTGAPDLIDAADSILADKPTVDDPRHTAWMIYAASRRNELGDAAQALDDRATSLGQTSEAGALRLRAAQLSLDAGNAARATTLLGQVESQFPSVGIISDLLATARRRSGDRPSLSRSAPPANAPASRDAFARIVRDGDLAVTHGDGAGAVAMYQRALELRPNDPLATLPLVRLANQIREPGPLTALALEQLKIAEAAGDAAGKADAYELLAHIDKELRQDPGAAQIALESASQADPTRVDLMHRLEREYAVTDQIGELLRLRRAELDQTPAEATRDRAALVMDTAGLADRDQRPDAELTELYRQALAADPRHRLALLHLESITRRAGGSAELADLEQQIAAYFDGDPKTQATFFTRAAETLAEIDKIDAAVQMFGRADQVAPGHVPALEGWRNAALKGQLWIDVAQAATRQGNAAGDAEAKAALHHFAGVALMDKALEGGQAMQAFRRALEADPSHKDSFLRLRILLEEDANHDELAIVLAKRLDFESDDRIRTELHRAVAELHRNFLDDRETAKQHYREILTVEPNDLRSHAAIADIAWEQGSWQEAADALFARARLESDPKILTTLLYRLGLLYADRLNDPGMALKAFQRALSYQPDDENTLVRLADLATQTGEWKLALGACERLVKSTEDPEKRAQHLHRVARIFKQGFGDNKRAERALNLALDGAPTNDIALQKLVEFYRDAGDMVSVRVHLNRVAGTMRNRVAADPRDGVAYRVISRAMTARAAAGVDGSIPIARAAAELATLLGDAGEPERLLLAEPRRIDLAPLVRPEADEVLFPRTVQPELRTLFQMLGDRLTKHASTDLRATYGVGRGDRLRAKDSPIAAHAQDVASGLGFGDIDVYVSTRTPYAMVAEPMSPVALVIGAEIAKDKDPQKIRFAAGAALKLAQASMAIPARMSESELGILVVALLRQFAPDFPQEGLDDAQIAQQMQKLKRLIPTGVMNELRPIALAIDAPHFKHEQLARDLRITGLRAGLVASGSILAGLGILAVSAGTDVPSFLADPVAQGLITFALGEDHAAVTR